MISALDADVIKSYVELGLVVGVIASMVFTPKKDETLVCVDFPAEFPTNTARLAVRLSHCRLGYAYRFIELCSLEIEETLVREVILPLSDVGLGHTHSGRKGGWGEIHCGR